MHRQDITIPLGRRVDMPADAAALAASRVWSVGRMFHASKRLTGLQSTSRLVIWVRTVRVSPAASGDVDVDVDGASGHRPAVAAVTRASPE